MSDICVNHRCVCFCVGILLLHGTYLHNCNRPNNSRYHDECSAGKESHKRDLSFQIDVDSPKKRQGD